MAALRPASVDFREFEGRAVFITWIVVVALIGAGWLQKQ
jgi:hypothetical protein